MGDMDGTGLGRTTLAVEVDEERETESSQHRADTTEPVVFM